VVYSTSALDYSALALGLLITNSFAAVVALSDLLGTGPHGFGLVFVLIAVWLDYWWLFRVSYRLRLSNGSLAWRGILTSGSVSMDVIRRVRPFRLGNGFIVIEQTQGRPLVVPVYRGLAEFVECLREQRPELPIRFGWFNRLQMALTIWSRFSGRRPG
jgi:hypothetical protein